MKDLLPIADALAMVIRHAPRLPVVSMALSAAGGRTLACRLVADRDQPPFDRSAMDGIATRAADTHPGALLRISGVAAAGVPFMGTMPVGACVRIFTGAVVPSDADTVVPVERISVDNEVASLSASAPVGQHIARQGCETREGAAIVEAGELLTATRLAVAAAFGHAQIQVSRAPRVAIVPTGDELVDVSATPGPGQIRDSNRYALAQIFRQGGAEVVDMPTAADEATALHASLCSALRAADVVVTCGGVSAGDLDLVAPALSELGANILFHKIAIKPGKPLLFATLGEKIVLGLPGNPVSAAVCALLFGLPLLAAMQGRGSPSWQIVRLPLAQGLPAVGARDEIVPLFVTSLAGRMAVSPIATVGSADIFAFSRAQLLGMRPAGQAPLAAGDALDVFLWPTLHP
ncbi:MAG: molybdopterin molybdenumtransferase MoeA [Myxococcales bacterium]|nr:molybdopterin molybdenumtransferase MoeA [Myxococcales bacterium]